MGAFKDIDIDKTNSQQEAGEDIQLTQEQREAVNKAVALVSKVVATIAERLVPAIQQVGEAFKSIAQQAQARLKHQRAVQGLKKDRKKGQQRTFKGWKHKAYIIKGTAKAKSSR